MYMYIGYLDMYTSFHRGHLSLVCASQYLGAILHVHVHDHITIFLNFSVLTKLDETKLSPHLHVCTLYILAYKIEEGCVREFTVYNTLYLQKTLHGFLQM